MPLFKASGTVPGFKHWFLTWLVGQPCPHATTCLWSRPLPGHDILAWAASAPWTFMATRTLGWPWLWPPCLPCSPCRAPASEDAAPAGTVQPQLLLPWSCPALLHPCGWPQILSPFQNIWVFSVALKYSPLRLEKTQTNKISKVRIFSYCKYWILCSSKFSAREGRVDISALKQNLLCIHRRNVLHTYGFSFFIQKRLHTRNFLLKYLLLGNSLVMNTKWFYL